jgi:hypothetical protein
MGDDHRIWPSGAMADSLAVRAREHALERALRQRGSRAIMDVLAVSYGR